MWLTILSTQQKPQARNLFSISRFAPTVKIPRKRKGYEVEFVNMYVPDDKSSRLWKHFLFVFVF